MPYNPDSEDALELAVMALFEALGWETVRAYDEAFSPAAATPAKPYLGRTGRNQTILAEPLRAALANAAFIAFTGTPLIAGEERTREVFGDYLSVYNFRQSMADQATVPLYYENRIPELQIINDSFNREIEQALEAAALSDEAEAQVERQFRREYQLITRQARLERIGQDIVEHFTGRAYRGKAMVVAIDKVTAVRLYDYVQAYWQAKKAALAARLVGCDPLEQPELERQLALFDLLIHPPELGLSPKERQEVKNAVQTLLVKLKEGRLGLDWRKRPQAQAQVLITIKDILDEYLPPAYTPDLYEQKCEQVYQHLYEHYYDDGGSAYTPA